MKNNLKSINALLLGILIALIFIPILQSLIKVLIIYPLLLIWTITALVIDDKKIVFKNSGIIYFIYFCFLFLMLYLVTKNATYLRRIVTYFGISYFSIIMFSFYKRHLDIIEKYVWFIFFCIVAGLLTTIPGLIQYPQASRILATGADKYASQFDLYQRIGIGGYGFIYALVIFSIFMPNVMRAYSGIAKRILIFIYLGMFLCIFLSGYTTAILLTIAMLIISAVIAKKNANAFIIVIIIGIIFTLILLFLREILIGIGNIADRLNIYYVSTRIDELITAEESGDFLSLERGQLYLNAIKNFFSSPIIGLMSRYTKLDSDHSQVLGYLETFGILGLPYLIFMIKWFKDQAKLINNRSIRYVLICCQWFYVIFAFINNVDVAYPLVWSGLFIVPIISIIFDKRVNNTVILQRKL